MRTTSSDLDFDPPTDKKLLAWLALAFGVVALMTSAAIQNNTRQTEHAAWLKQTEAFVRETDAISSSARAADPAVMVHLDRATELAFENDERLDRLGAMSALLETRTPAALKEIASRVEANRAAEHTHITDREQALARHTRRTEQILYGGGILTLLLLGLGFRSVRIDLKARRSATLALQEKLGNRTAELSAALDKLQVENIEQQFSQAALERVVSHHELVLNSIHEGVFVVSKNGSIVSANPAAADLTRKEARQLAGKSIGSVLLNEDRLPFPWEKHFLRRPLKNGTPIRLSPATVKQADGALLDVQIACYPTRDRENLTGAVITVAPRGAVRS